VKRDIFGLGLLWLALSVIGVAAAAVIDFYPVARLEKGEEIERAFRFLLVLSMPVLALVVAVLVWAMVRHASFRMPETDGMPLQGKGLFPFGWFVVTTALTAVVMVYGIMAIPKVMGHEHDADVVVRIEGIQWTWLVSYPDDGVANAREIVLPVDRTVRFDITSRDVLHSFWIPAFLMKIDAVPGLTTTMSLKPTKMGTFDTDPNLRVQCAELCGISHARMRIPVRVVSGEEYQAWLANQPKPSASPTPGTLSGPVVELAIIGVDNKWDQETLRAPAGSTVKLKIDNQD
jgi:cytochrome c oxidase subunit 2